MVIIIDETLRSCYDPEIPVNIRDLGLIYEVNVDAPVFVKMTLTTRDCPVAGSLPAEVEQKLAAIDGVSRSHVELVWDPPRHPSRISEPGRHQLSPTD